MKQLIPIVLSITVGVVIAVPIFAAAADKPAPSAKPVLSDKAIQSDKAAQADKAAQSVKSLPSEKIAKPAKRETVKSKRTVSGLVPPPPPSVPTLGNLAPGVTVVGEYIEYMSKAELLELKTKLEAQLDRERRRLSLNQDSYAEKKKRSESFEQLFAEGVVSKRELETAKQESLRMEDDLPQSESTVKDLESRLSRIEKRLKTLPAEKLPRTESKLSKSKAVKSAH